MADFGSLKCTAPDSAKGIIQFQFSPEKISQQLGQQQIVASNTSPTEPGATPPPRPPAIDQGNLRSPKLSFKIYLRAAVGAQGAIADKTKVRSDAVKIQRWLKPVPGVDPKKKDELHHPVVEFSWGTGFQGIQTNVTSANIDFLSFTDDGFPLLASVDLQLTMLNEFDWVANQNPTSGGTAPIGAHLMLDGDTLPSVAFKTYGKAAHWRRLAAINGIDDPLRVRPGTMLRLPVEAELTPGPGS